VGWVVAEIGSFRPPLPQSQLVVQVILHSLVALAVGLVAPHRRCGTDSSEQMATASLMPSLLAVGLVVPHRSSCQSGPNQAGIE
jgi:hypothetical protein